MELFSHGRRFEFAISTDDQASWQDWTRFLTDASETESTELADVTTAADDGMHYLEGQLDGSVTVNAILTADLDRQIDAIVDRGEPVHYRYRPTGTLAGRLELRGHGPLSAVAGTAPVGDKVGTSVTLETSDTDYLREVQA